MNETSPTVDFRIGTSGRVSPHGGIGVIQNMVLPRLVASGIEVIMRPDREKVAGRINKITAVLSASMPVRGVDVFLSLVPPAPIAVDCPTVSVVHDLRWQRTRGLAARTYRRADLIHTLRISDIVLCVSSRTAVDLAALNPRSRTKIEIISLGPGQVEETYFGPPHPGTVLMVGGARHKRNEIAAEAICLSKPEWVRRVVGVGVSDLVQDIFSMRWPALKTEWLTSLSETEMLALYRTAEYFVHLGREEGFGLPYIEALSSGCQVIVSDQPLTRALLGDAAITVKGDDVPTLAGELKVVSNVPNTIRQQRAARFDWDSCAAQIRAAIVDVAGCSGKR